MKMAEITDIGMLFVRCGNGGISHHPDETMNVADAELAARAFEDFLAELQDRCMSRSDSMTVTDVRRAASSRRETQFLAELVRIPSDNPPGDCAPAAQRAQGCSSNWASTSKSHVVPDATVQANGMISCDESRSCANVSARAVRRSR